MDDVRAAMKGMLAPVLHRAHSGLASARLPLARGAIAGCMVTEGVVRRGSEVRVLRGKETVFAGKLSSLRHAKDDVRDGGRLRDAVSCWMVSPTIRKGISYSRMVEVFRA